MKTNERVFNEAKSLNMFDKLRLLFHKRVKTSRSQQEKLSSVVIRPLKKFK